MKVLVVRFRAFGDCVMAAWAVSAIRAAHPEAEINWAVEPHCSAAIDTELLVQQIHQVDRRAPLRAQLGAYLALRQMRPDFAFDFQGHLKTALALRFARPRRWAASYATDVLARRLNHAGPEPISHGHTVDHHLSVVQRLLPVVPIERPLMPSVSPPAGLGEGGWISICTGGSSERKRYPREQWQTVADALREAEHRVVTVGANGDPPLEGAENWVGRLGWRETMGVIAASSVHLAPDTGTGHIASAYGVPVISLFGTAKHTPERFRPYGERVCVLQSAGHSSEVQPEAVVRAVKRALELGSWGG